MAKDANRYQVKNANDPTPGNITEEKESELEEFIDYAKIVMGTLGHKVFEKLIDPTPMIESVEDRPAAKPLLYLRHKSRKSQITVEAQCRQTAEGFVVLKGSRIQRDDSEGVSPGIKEIRRAANVDDNGTLQEDILFKSPSAAASFVTGGSENGWTKWQAADGRALKDAED